VRGLEREEFECGLTDELLSRRGRLCALGPLGSVLDPFDRSGKSSVCRGMLVPLSYIEGEGCLLKEADEVPRRVGS
jgi:hypothetical protein